MVACNPTDESPPDPVAARQDIADTFADVTTFYDQASYGDLSAPASWFAPIGGVLASVTPKHRGRVRLDRDFKQGERVTVTGKVEPHIDRQQVRVDMTRPDATVDVDAVLTDATGRFEASFVLLRKRRRTGAIEQGTYAFQAHVMGATRIAPADSNVVFLQIGDKPKREDATTSNGHERLFARKQKTGGLASSEVAPRS